MAKLSERQTDFEELVTGPPVSAAFKPDGEPTPAAAGFARKYGVDVTALERHATPKGEYLAYRVRQRGKATVDVLADQDIRQGIKAYSDWPTIPQLYVKGEFVGGSDIMMEMFESGELKQLVDAEGNEG